MTVTRNTEGPRVVRITRRDGGDVTPKQAAIITAAAHKFIAGMREQQAGAANVAVPTKKTNGNWAHEGRALVHTSHNVAHQPARLAMAAVATGYRNGGAN